MMTCHIDHSWSDDPEYNVPLGQGEREAQWCGQFSDEPDNMPRTKNVDRVVGAIFSAKFQLCNDTFTGIFFTLLVAKTV